MVALSTPLVDQNRVNLSPGLSDDALVVKYSICKLPTTTPCVAVMVKGGCVGIGPISGVGEGPAVDVVGAWARVGVGVVLKMRVGVALGACEGVKVGRSVGSTGSATAQQAAVRTTSPSAASFVPLAHPCRIAPAHLTHAVRLNLLAAGQADRLRACLYTFRQFRPAFAECHPQSGICTRSRRRPATSRCAPGAAVPDRHPYPYSARQPGSAGFPGNRG